MDSFVGRVKCCRIGLSVALATLIFLWDYASIGDSHVGMGNRIGA